MDRQFQAYIRQKQFPIKFYANLNDEIIKLCVLESACFWHIETNLLEKFLRGFGGS